MITGITGNSMSSDRADRKVGHTRAKHKQKVYCLNQRILLFTIAFLQVEDTS